jgi:hypothetical protein
VYEPAGLGPANDDGEEADMKLRRWDAVVVAAVAATSAVVFAALGPRAAQADGADPAERIRKSLDSAKKVALAGCRLSACPTEPKYEVGSEQQIVLRATNPTSSPVALSMSIVAEDMKFTLSRVPIRVKGNATPFVECPLTLVVEPGQTVETRVAFKLTAGNYAISARIRKPGVEESVQLCGLLVSPLIAIKPADAQPQTIAAKQNI